MADSPHDLTDTFDLVHHAKDGRRDALDRLFARYEARIRKVVRMRLGEKLRRHVDSADIVQDTFVNAMRALRTFEIRSEASVINWLAKISENTIRDAAQRYDAVKRKPKGVVPIDPKDSEDEAVLIVDQAPGPSDQAAAVDDESQMADAMSELSEEYREIIVLRDYCGYTWAEVAKEHGRPSEDAARAMHAKAMIQLGRILRR